MRRLGIFCLLMVKVVSSYGQDSELYQQAFERYISQSEWYGEVEGALKPDDFLASKYVYSFDDYCPFFRHDMPENLCGYYEDRKSEPKLVESFGKKRSHRKVYFTNVKEGYFIAELHYDLIKRDKGMPDIYFGTVYQFLFKKTDKGELQMISSHALSVN